MKKVSNFITLISCLSPVVVTPFIFLTSCSQTMTTEIDVQHKLQTGNESSYLFPFMMSNAPLTPVHVKILDDTSNYLSLEQNIFDLRLIKKSATIKINISELCTKSTHFNFKLQFWFTNILKQDEKIVINGFDIYYNYSPEVKTDQVRTERLMIEQTNNYTFDFVLQFSAMPYSNVFVDLSGEEKGKLFIPDEDFITGYEVQIEDGYYVAHIPVNVNRSQKETQVFTFSLDVLFVNSFGIGQEIILDNLVASFVYNPDDDTLPAGFLEYKKVNGRLVLTGINKQVVDPETTFPKYHTIIIPEGVTDIGADALADRELFKNVTKIVFPESLQAIEADSLRGCFNIQEMDVTSSGSFIPTWMYNDSDIFGNLKTNSNICEAGNVWIGDQSNRKEINKLLHYNAHMPSLWKSFSEEAVIPEEFFVIEGTKLVSIKTAYTDELKNYQVIKIPDYITELDKDCLRPLGYEPALNPDMTDEHVDKFITRRLVLNKNLEKIGDSALMETDIGGPLCINCPKLESIGANAFNKCTRNYYDPYFRQDSICEELHISFLNSNNLTTIGEGCFLYAGIHGTIDLPINLTTINTNSFSMTRDEVDWRTEEVTKLVVHNKLLNIQGDYALAYMEMLWTIDVSEFETLPDWANEGKTNHLFHFDGHNFGQYAEKGTIICKSSLINSWKNSFPDLLGLWEPIDKYYVFVGKD